MAKFKKGESGNPSGRPKKTIQFKYVQQVITKDICDIALKIFEMSSDELKVFLDKNVNKMTPASRLIIKKIVDGDFRVLVYIIERFLGRPMESIDLSSNDGPLNPIIKVVIEKREK